MQLDILHCANKNIKLYTHFYFYMYGSTLQYSIHVHYTWQYIAAVSLYLFCRDVVVLEDQSLYSQYCRELMERDPLVLLPKQQAIISTVQTTFRDYLSKLKRQGEDEGGMAVMCSEAPSSVGHDEQRTGLCADNMVPIPRWTPIDCSLPGLGRASEQYAFVPSYDLMTRLPLQLVPTLSSSLQFLLRVGARVVGHTPEQLLAAVGKVEVEVRRNIEQATLTVATLSATPELQAQRRVIKRKRTY